MSSTERLLIAHRGERILAPENTIRGCHLALEQGATALEVDVQQCGSSELVLMHDLYLYRCFGRMKTVAASPLSELRELRFADGFYKYPDVLCTLEEFLEEFRGTVPLNLDLKSLRGNNRTFIDTFARLITRMDLHRDIWISSFNPMLVKGLKQRDVRIRTGYLFQKPGLINEYIDGFLDTDAWHPHHKNFSDRLYEKAKRLNKKIYVWTVNRDEVLKRLDGYDIDGIITDVYFRTGGLA